MRNNVWYYLWFLVCCVSCSTRPATGEGKADHLTVWQWSTEVNSIISSETKDHPEAFLWIPEDCEKVKGLIFTQHNMIERGILEHKVFRDKMRKLGFAEIWVTPKITLEFDFHSTAPEDFQHMLEKLAEESGYKELTVVPVVPMGHSALATFPWNFAAWDPGRTLAVVSIHGDAPQTSLTGYGGKNVDWRNRNIDYVPGLFIMGEYEWWEDRITPAFEYIEKHPDSPVTLFADAGHGHFDYSDMLVKYIADYIQKAAEYRIQDSSELKPVVPEDGWLMDRWRRDSLPQWMAAPFAEFEGERKTASWVFDEEMAADSEAYYSKSRGKKQQYIGIIQKGDTLTPQKTHVEYPLDFEPLEDGISFTVNAFFADSTRMQASGEHAVTSLIINKLTGPVRKINDTTFQIHFDELGFNNPRRSNDIWLLAYNEGDENYKSMVQQMNLRFPLVNKEGKSQSIAFEPIPDQKEGIEFISLNATSSAGAEIRFYVKKGPAYVQGDTLHFTDIPPAAKFPVAVEVVAWQYGNPEKLQSVEPVERHFYIEKVNNRK